MRARLLLPALVAFALACGDDGDSAPADGGEPRDAGDAGRAEPECSPGVAAKVAITDAEQGPPFGATFAWTGDGIVAVRAAQSGGYRLIELDPQGRERSAPQTLWPGEQAAEKPRIAVSGDVLAIADSVPSGPNMRASCRLGLARLGGQDAIRAPARISDPTEDGSVLNEAQTCDVAAAGEDFVLVWQQYVSSTSLDISVFAQWIARDGAPEGERLTVLTADQNVKLDGLTLTGDGTHAVLAHANAGQPGVSLSFIERDQVRTVAAELDSPLVELAVAHDGLLARAYDQLSLLDHDGRRRYGPLPLQAGALAAPLGDGYVAVERDDFLVARTYDPMLATGSDPLGISEDRSAHGDALIYAPDGSATALIFGDQQGLQLVPLACGDEPVGPPGPPACRERDDLEPLDDGCSDEVCHTVIRLDYLTLGMRGWSVAGGPLDPVDADGAERAAREVLDANSEYLQPETMISGPTAGLFSAFVSPSDFGAFALIGEDSGLVVAAGGVVWSGRGQYWVPEEWKPASDLACGSEPAVPAMTHVDPDSACIGFGGETSATARDALTVALRSNLAAFVAGQGPFSAYVYLYTPGVGACDAGAAEYLVVLTRKR